MIRTDDGPSKGWEVVERGDTAALTLWYPRTAQEEGRIWRAEIDLCDVRAADSIRVSYDFERDGWKIEQASTFSWPVTDEVCDQDWQEVAFVQAWAREEKEEEPAT